EGSDGLKRRGCPPVGSFFEPSPDPGDPEPGPVPVVRRRSPNGSWLPPLPWSEGSRRGSGWGRGGGGGGGFGAGFDFGCPPPGPSGVTQPPSSCLPLPLPPDLPD